MNIDSFLEERVHAEIKAKAVSYANAVISHVENTYTKSYDDAVRLFRKEGKTLSEAYEISELSKLTERWERQSFGNVSELCHKVCPKELADYFTDGNYGCGVFSYEKGGRVFRRGLDTEVLINEWAEERADEKVEFLKSRIVSKLKEKFPSFEIGNEIVFDIVDIHSGSETLNWRFSTSDENGVRASVDTKLIFAGGHNVQSFHTRFLVSVKRVVS